MAGPGLPGFGNANPPNNPADKPQRFFNIPKHQEDVAQVAIHAVKAKVRGRDAAPRDELIAHYEGRARELNTFLDGLAAPHDLPSVKAAIGNPPLAALNFPAGNGFTTAMDALRANLVIKDVNGALVNNTGLGALVTNADAKLNNTLHAQNRPEPKIRALQAELPEQQNGIKRILNGGAPNDGFAVIVAFKALKTDVAFRRTNPTLTDEQFDKIANAMEADLKERLNKERAANEKFFQAMEEKQLKLAAFEYNVAHLVCLQDEVAEAHQERVDPTVQDEDSFLPEMKETLIANKTAFPKKGIFFDKKNNTFTFSDIKDAAAAIEMAALEGFKQVTITGSNGVKEELYKLCVKKGLEVVDYEPSEKLLAWKANFLCQQSIMKIENPALRAKLLEQVPDPDGLRNKLPFFSPNVTTLPTFTDKQLAALNALDLSTVHDQDAVTEALNSIGGPGTGLSNAWTTNLKLPTADEIRAGHGNRDVGRLDTYQLEENLAARDLKIRELRLGTEGVWNDFRRRAPNVASATTVTDALHLLNIHVAAQLKDLESLRTALQARLNAGDPTARAKLEKLEEHYLKIIQGFNEPRPPGPDVPVQGCVSLAQEITSRNNSLHAFIEARHAGNNDSKREIEPIRKVFLEEGRKVPAVGGLTLRANEIANRARNDAAGINARAAAGDYQPPRIR